MPRARSQYTWHSKTDYSARTDINAKTNYSQAGNPICVSFMFWWSASDGIIHSRKGNASSSEFIWKNGRLHFASSLTLVCMIFIEYYFCEYNRGKCVNICLKCICYMFRYQGKGFLKFATGATGGNKEYINIYWMHTTWWWIYLWKHCPQWASMCQWWWHASNQSQASSGRGMLRGMQTLSKALMATHHCELRTLLCSNVQAYWSVVT